MRNPRTKPCNGNVKYYKIGSLSGSVRMPMLRNHVACCAIRLPGHNTTLPPKSARSYSQAPPGEGLTPHTIHYYSFGPLQAITIVSHSDPDSQTLAQDSSQDSDSCALARGLRSTFVHRSVSPERRSVAARVAAPLSVAFFAYFVLLFCIDFPVTCSRKAKSIKRTSHMPSADAPPRWERERVGALGRPTYGSE